MKDTQKYFSQQKITCRRCRKKSCAKLHTEVIYKKTCLHSTCSKSTKQLTSAHKGNIYSKVKHAIHQDSCSTTSWKEKKPSYKPKVTAPTDLWTMLITKNPNVQHLWAPPLPHKSMGSWHMVTDHRTLYKPLQKLTSPGLLSFSLFSFDLWAPLLLALGRIWLTALATKALFTSHPGS